MADYNIVKHCRICRERFVVNKSEKYKSYCDGCQLKVKNDTQGGKK